MVNEERWPAARLIPISAASGVEAQERRATSALLAVMSAVPEFGRALLKPLGTPSGRIDTFIEVSFKKLDGESLRPDGVISVSRGSRSWRALLEAKTASNPLEPQQVEWYLDLARELEFDAVLTISNQLMTTATSYPIEVDKRKLRSVSLFHWSWTAILTEAVVQREYRGVSDPDQAYILQELIRYLGDRRSGVIGFESMGPSWTVVRDGVRDQTIRKGDVPVAAIAVRWDELVRFIALELTRDLGRSVKHVLPIGQRSPEGRLEALCDSLVTQGRLQAELHVPDTAGPISLVADLRSRQIVVSSKLDAPREGKSRGRVSWLLRQLQGAPDALRIEAHVTYLSSTIACTLGQAKLDPGLLIPNGDRDIRQFTVALTSESGLNRDVGRGSFIDSVQIAVSEFYENVLQKLRPWKPTAPKLQRPGAEDETREEVSVPLPRMTELVDDAPPGPTGIAGQPSEIVPAMSQHMPEQSGIEPREKPGS